MSDKKTCAGPQCDRAVRTKGLCNSHYEQQRKGLMLKPLRPTREFNMSIEETGRWISEQVEIDSDSGCWIWPFGLCKGYGAVRVQGKTWYTHRLMFSVFVGPLVEGLHVDHIDCVSTACCNPAHLRQASPAGNQQNRQKLHVNSTSGQRGVSWDKRREKWRAYIMVDRKHLFLGYFTNLDDAIAARKASEQHHHPYRDPEYREPVAS